MTNQPEKKKRGRKPKDVIKQKEKKTNSESNIILHLPIDNKFNTLLQEDKLLTYNPSVDIPQPNQTMGLNHKFSNVEFLRTVMLRKSNGKPNQGHSKQTNDKS